MMLEVRDGDILYVAVSNLKTHERSFFKTDFLSLWNKLKERYNFTIRPESTHELEQYLNRVNSYKLYVVYFSKEESKKFVEGVKHDDKRRKRRNI